MGKWRTERYSNHRYGLCFRHFRRSHSADTTHLVISVDMLEMFMNCSYARRGQNMPDQQPVTETKSSERLVFEHYLRTGQLSTQAWVQEVEYKFNPYHDQRNGGFTFAPGGPRSLSHVIVSDRRGLHRRTHIFGSIDCRCVASVPHSAINTRKLLRRDRVRNFDKRWAACHQYSDASVIVSKRVVTSGLAGSGDP